jgi:hypothetical protein
MLAMILNSFSASMNSRAYLIVLWNIFNLSGFGVRSRILNHDV